MSARNRRRIARGALAALTCATSLLAYAAPVDWAGERFVYRTDGASVGDALHVLAAGQQLPLRIDGQLRGVVSGRFSMPPQRFLDVLGRSYGFVWYYDGAALRVSPASAQQHIAIRPHFVSASALRSSLEQAGVTDSHFPLVVDASAQTVDVTGPATYVARIRDAAERFEHDARKHVRTTVRVFRLAVAHAADETRVIDGRRIVVPGAATLLRRRFEPHAAPLGGGDAQAAQGTGATEVVQFDEGLPVIEADTVTNSILIRDKADRIDADGALVAELDLPARLISVQTWVVDVDADAFASLAAALPPAMSAAAEPSSDTAGAGVAPDRGRALLAQLQALARSGQAGIEVSQTALTQDRSPAIIDRHEARLAQREQDGESGDGSAVGSADLWLSVEPVVDGAAESVRRIGLRVELGHRDDARRYRSVDATVAPGDCLVLEGAPRRVAQASESDDAGKTGIRRRLVLLIPRVAA